jgi:hypothetical protein
MTLQIIIGLGIAAAFFVILTAGLGAMILKGKTNLLVKDHRILAIIAILLLVAHAAAVIIWLYK